MAIPLHHWRRVQVLLPVAVAIAAALLVTCSAHAQNHQNGGEPSNSANLGIPFQDLPSTDDNVLSKKKAGVVATSSVGTAGERLEYGQGLTNTKAMGRRDMRIANRVQSRIRNRIDRFYDPQANAASPFKVATDKTRVTSPQSP